METDITTSLSTLVSDFNARIDELSRVASFKNEVADLQVQERLKHTSNELRALEAKIASIRENIAIEQQLWSQAEQLQDTAARQQNHLDYIQSHLPSRLPGPVTPSPKKRRVKVKEQQPKKKAKARNVHISVPNVAYVTKGELDSVPSYMRGRTALDTINSGVDLIRKTLKAKYTILSTPWPKLSEIEMRKHTEYIDQESDETDGLYFFTDADFRASAAGTSMDSATFVKNITQILRHEMY